MKHHRVLLLIMFMAVTLGTALAWANSSSLLDLGGRRMTDPEFDHLGFQVTWQDEDDNLWVAPVDPLTGY